MVKNNGGFLFSFSSQKICIDCNSFRGGTRLKILTRMIEISADNSYTKIFLETELKKKNGGGEEIRN